MRELHFPQSEAMLDMARYRMKCEELFFVELGLAARREIVLRVARALESEPSVLGCSAHLMVVGRKPTTRLTSADTLSS